MTELSQILPQAEVSREAFREGMACLAGAVNIVTTDGPGGRAGLTASAVCAVTDTPPRLLVCVNRSSSAGPAFAKNSALCVNTVGPDHQDLAMLFGGKTPMDERFTKADWQAGLSGAPILRGAAVAFDCQVAERVAQGSHEVLFCDILQVIRAEKPSSLIYFSRKFHALEG
ncbi:MAG: flavin reductase [Mangrovicoccus sp.]